MKGCDAKCGDNTELPPELLARVHSHPCFSEEAHHHYARMHVAVAPACNIQCNYCNRLYDCANESRPGVTSELLTPEEAVRKVLVVGGRLPQLSVVGVAGPGDAFANPEETFRTLELIAEKAPDLRFCLSTNGLRLVDYIDRIKALNVDHVTVTVNAVDADIAKLIYRWVFFKNRRYTGREGAKILLERQSEGLQALKENDILCKVNSVLIPGINDEHMPMVAEHVKSLGAFLHNIMPMILAKGSFYGIHGYRGPTPQELLKVQQRCSGQVTLMRHCRQCRADAVGLLGEDLSDAFKKEHVLSAPIDYDIEKRRAVQLEIEGKIALARSARKALNGDIAEKPRHHIRVAVSSKGGGLVNQHFGHANEFLIYEADADDIRFIGTRGVQRYCFGSETCGDEEKSMEKIIELLSDCRAVLCSRIGPGPRKALEQAGIACIETYDLIPNAVDQVARQLDGDVALVGE